MPLHSNFPSYVSPIARPSGPFRVSVLDIEWSLPDPSGGGALGLTCRLFYPCGLPTDTGTDALKAGARCTAVRWAPSWHYLAGIIDFVKLPAFFSVPALVSIVGHSEIPATLEEPLLPAARLVAALPNCSSDQKFPVAVWSHGLGSMRAHYSVACLDLASHGFVVAAPEHRDSSACYAEINNRTAHIAHRHLKAGENDFEVRNTQVRQRSDEVGRVLDLLEMLARGTPPTNMLADSRLDLKIFAGRLDVSRPCMLGHSFGGATTVTSVYSHPRFVAAVAQDVWMFPVTHEFLERPLPVPLLFINTEKFTWPENSKQIADLRAKLVAGAPADDAPLVTLLNTGHNNQSDFSVMMPRIISKFNPAMLGTGDHEVVHRVNCRLTLSYLKSKAHPDSPLLQHVPAFDIELENDKQWLVQTPQ